MAALHASCVTSGGKPAKYLSTAQGSERPPSAEPGRRHQGPRIQGRFVLGSGLLGQRMTRVEERDGDVDVIVSPRLVGSAEVILQDERRKQSQRQAAKRKQPGAKGARGAGKNMAGKRENGKCSDARSHNGSEDCGATTDGIGAREETPARQQNASAPRSVRFRVVPGADKGTSRTGKNKKLSKTATTCFQASSRKSTGVRGESRDDSREITATEKEQTQTGSSSPRNRKHGDVCLGVAGETAGGRSAIESAPVTTNVTLNLEHHGESDLLSLPEGCTWLEVARPGDGSETTAEREADRARSGAKVRLGARALNCDNTETSEPATGKSSLLVQLLESESDKEAKILPKLVSRNDSGNAEERSVGTKGATSRTTRPDCCDSPTKKSKNSESSRAKPATSKKKKSSTRTPRKNAKSKAASSKDERSFVEESRSSSQGFTHSRASPDSLTESAGAGAGMFSCSDPHSLTQLLELQQLPENMFNTSDAMAVECQKAVESLQMMTDSDLDFLQVSGTTLQAQQESGSFLQQDCGLQQDGSYLQISGGVPQQEGDAGTCSESFAQQQPSWTESAQEDGMSCEDGGGGGMSCISISDGVLHVGQQQQHQSLNTAFRDWTRDTDQLYPAVDIIHMDTSTRGKDAGFPTLTSGTRDTRLFLSESRDVELDPHLTPAQDELRATLLQPPRDGVVADVPDAALPGGGGATAAGVTASSPAGPAPPLHRRFGTLLGRPLNSSTPIPDSFK